jgi:hypothetical protein
MDNLRAGISFLLLWRKTLPAVAQRRFLHSQIDSGILAIHSGTMLATHSGIAVKVANFRPEQVANFPPESVANFDRNRRPTWSGIRRHGHYEKTNGTCGGCDLWKLSGRVFAGYCKFATWKIAK